MTPATATPPSASRMGSIFARPASKVTSLTNKVSKALFVRFFSTFSSWKDLTMRAPPIVSANKEVTSSRCSCKLPDAFRCATPIRIMGRIAIG